MFSFSYPWLINVYLKFEHVINACLCYLFVLLSLLPKLNPPSRMNMMALPFFCYTLLTRLLCSHRKMCSQIKKTKAQLNIFMHVEKRYDFMSKVYTAVCHTYKDVTDTKALMSFVSLPGNLVLKWKLFL